MTKLQGEMESDYATVGVCGYKDPNNCTFRLDPGNYLKRTKLQRDQRSNSTCGILFVYLLCLNIEIENILTTSQDPQELAHYWTAW